LAEILPELKKSLPDIGIVGLDFAPPKGSAFDALLTRARRQWPQSGYRSVVVRC